MFNNSCITRHVKSNTVILSLLQNQGVYISPKFTCYISVLCAAQFGLLSSTFRILGRDGVLVECCEKHIIDVSSLFNFLLKVWLLRGYVVCLVLGLSVYVHSWRLLCLRLQSHLLFFKARLAASRLPTISSFLGLH